MINKPPPLKGLNSSMPIITPVKGRGFINQGSGLVNVPFRTTVNLKCLFLARLSSLCLRSQPSRLGTKNLGRHFLETTHVANLL